MNSVAVTVRFSAVPWVRQPVPQLPRIKTIITTHHRHRRVITTAVHRGEVHRMDTIALRGKGKRATAGRRGLL
jgi:hypothetical protein